MNNLNSRLSRIEASLPVARQHLIMFNEHEDPAATVAKFRADRDIKLGDRFLCVRWQWTDAAAIARFEETTKDLH